MCVRISIFIFYQVQSLAYWFAHTYIQVNLCQKLFLNQLTHNMTRDCSLNSRKIQVDNVLCTIFLLLFCFDIQNNISVQHVVNLYFLWNSMNNLSSSLQETHMFSTLCPTQKVWCCVFLQA